MHANWSANSYFEWRRCVQHVFLNCNTQIISLRKESALFLITEMSFVSTMWSKTIINFKAICGWSSLLNYFASSSGVQLLQRRFGWAVHYALKSKLGDTHTSVDIFFFTSQAISNMQLEKFVCVGLFSGVAASNGVFFYNCVHTLVNRF